MRADRPGLTLLEVLVALALLGLGAAAWIGLASQSAHTLQLVHVRADQVQRASLVLSRISLWPRDRIAMLGGIGVTDGFHVRVLPVSSTLLEVSLAGSATGAALLRTSFHFTNANATR